MIDKIKNKKRWIILALLAAGIVIIVVTFYSKNDSPQSPPDLLVTEVPEEIEANTLDEKESKTIFVDVKGEVFQEGVIEMPKGKRVKDAIEQAGGFSEEADRKQVNLAALLEDEMVIYVPKMGEDYVVGPASEGGVQVEKGKVSINKGTTEELQTLPGIGPAKAEAIIAYREENGPFSKLEDLLLVSGIGEKSLERIIDLLTLN